MKLRGLTLLFAASLAALVVAAAGCGSKKSSSSTPSVAAQTTTTTAPHKKRAARLHAGEFCSLSKERAYKARGYTCVNGRLKPVGAAVVPTKTATTPTRTATTPTRTVTTTTTTTTRRIVKPYKVGQLCTVRLQSLYAKFGLTCDVKTGRLKKK